MRFDVFSLFPQLLQPYLEASIIQRAILNNKLEVHLHDIRNWAAGRHHVTDDAPYGGGGGMVMKPEPVFAAVEAILESPPAFPVILMTPQGRQFNQKVAGELAHFPRMGIICGRYEGIDERIREHLATDEISIGDFVLTGGELPALILIDAVSRLIPGVLGDPEGALDDSHATGLLEYPHYTRPPEFRGWSVPEVLLSGNHAEIAQWRRQQSLQRTLQRRPDMLKAAPLSITDRQFLEKFANHKPIEKNQDPSDNQKIGT
jgi:tRNA (guanine37-N1)-methyltransferase